MMYERVLLKTIKFDLQVTHPYSFLLQYAKRLKGGLFLLLFVLAKSWNEVFCYSLG